MIPRVELDVRTIIGGEGKRLAAGTRTASAQVS
jgi:hypothetical protein